jgi:preprotein translocase subunit SecF
MYIVTHKKFFFWLSGILVALSIASIVVFGFKPGIEFTGGSIIEVAYPEGRPDITVLQEKLAALEWPGTLSQPTGENGYIIRTKSLSEEERQKLVETLSGMSLGTMEQVRFDSIGPTIGAELRKKAWIAILLVILAIVLYVAFAFRHVSKPVSSWTYGLVTIVSLAHDVIIPTGIYVLMGEFFIDARIDVLFVIAILTVLGFSVHDTIVVFDRTRENLKLRLWKNFDETVGHSVEQTITRSINTSLTTLLVVIALYVFGPDSTKWFALVLGIGIIVGTYSSVFLGSPLLVAIEEWQRNREEERKRR